MKRQMVAVIFVMALVSLAACAKNDDEAVSEPVIEPVAETDIESGIESDAELAVPVSEAGDFSSVEETENTSTAKSLEEIAQESFQQLLSGDVTLVDDDRLASDFKDTILQYGDLEYTTLDLDGDNISELLIQEIDDPWSFNSVFHYDGEKLVCWNYDSMGMTSCDFPLQDGTMVSQYNYGGTRNYTVFRYRTNGEKEEISRIFARDELIPADSTDPCPYYEIDGKSFDEESFNVELEEKIYARMLERDVWKSF